MRIIGGSLGGRRLRAPPGAATRPTSDRVREAIFNILGPPAPGARALDAFAGSGALGLEALSRGAAAAVFIERSRAAARCVRDNAEKLGVAAACQVHVGDAPALLARWRPPGFDWVFVDPPYRGDLADRALAALGRGALLAAGAWVVVEHDRRRRPAETAGCLVRTDRRRYGDTEISFYRAASHTMAQQDRRDTRPSRDDRDDREPPEPETAS